MLIQLSPWDVVKTSIGLPRKTSRRRKLGQQQRSTFTEFPCGATFVTKSSLRSNQKKLRDANHFQLSDSFPLLSITSSHRVTVIDRSIKEKRYQESSFMQYSSRPGPSSSLFHTKIPKNGKSVKDFPNIPSFLDAKNDRLYAFQRGNTRLCSWNALKDPGPDCDSACRVDLRHPALSISLLPIATGVIYGTCADGSIYVARVLRKASKAEAESISVEYLAGPSTRGAQFAGMVGEVHAVKKTEAENKRKVSEPEARLLLAFYQIFYEGSTFMVVRHEVSSGKGDPSFLFVPTHSLETKRVDFHPTCRRWIGTWRIVRAKLLVSPSGISSQRVTVAYSIHRTKQNAPESTAVQLCATISLDTVSFSHNPVPLPPTTRQIGLVMENLLVAGTKDRVLLYDMQSGAHLHSIRVASLIGDSIEEWVLCADARLGTLAIIFPKGNKLHAAFSTPCIRGAELPLSAQRFNLANRISSSRTRVSTVKYRMDNRNNQIRIRDLDLGDGYRGDLRAGLNRSIQRALRTLALARQRLLRSDQFARPCCLLEAYEFAVASLRRDLNGRSVYNPQGRALVVESSTQNGSKSDHRITVPKPSVTNGKKAYVMQVQPSIMDRVATPTSAPQTFVDGAMTVVLSILLDLKTWEKTNSHRISRAQRDASLILSSLLRTGKVSARAHFERSKFSNVTSGRSLVTILRTLEPLQQNALNVVSPVDMIHEILRSCTDVSERQRVAMLSFIMCCTTLPDKAGLVFVDSMCALAHNQGTVLSKSNGSDKLSRLSSKLILAGMSVLLQRIVCYSPCNQAMLGAAFVDGLSRKQVALLESLFSKLITSHEFAQRSDLICEWIFTLCDSRRDALIESKHSLTGSSRLSSIHRVLVGAVAQSKAILSLQDDISCLLLGPRSRRTSKQKQGRKNVVRIKLPKHETEEEMPGYTIDHLVF